MGRTLKEIEKEFAGVLNNPEVYVVSQWYARGPESLGNSEPLDEKKYLQRARMNAKDISRVLGAIRGI